MSDSITDCNRDNEEYKLKHLNINASAKALRELRPFVYDYETIKAKLIKLGFRIEENRVNVKIWKEL